MGIVDTDNFMKDQKVLSALNKEGLKLKKIKYQFFFLISDFRISEEGIATFQHSMFLQLKKSLLYRTFEIC